MLTFKFKVIKVLFILALLLLLPCGVYVDKTRTRVVVVLLVWRVLFVIAILSSIKLGGVHYPASFVGVGSFCFELFLMF